MKFEGKRNGIVVMHATSDECIPDRETQKAMVKAGYRLYQNGKVEKP